MSKEGAPFRSNAELLSPLPSPRAFNTAYLSKSSWTASPSPVSNPGEPSIIPISNSLHPLSITSSASWATNISVGPTFCRLNPKISHPISTIITIWKTKMISLSTQSPEAPGTRADSPSASPSADPEPKANPASNGAGGVGSQQTVSNGSSSQTEAHAHPQAMVLDGQLSQMMGDAPFCDTCGHITVRNGSCYRCLNCGNSVGCS